MSGKPSSLINLRIRKQLLVTEAEVQREQLRQELDIIEKGVRSLGGQAKSIGSIASVAALLIAGLTAFRSARTRRLDRNGRHSSFLSKIFGGARLASTLLLALRSHTR
jgi:hypothetical protein